jgi:thioredoxin-like negative regulator of GroEL
VAEVEQDTGEVSEASRKQAKKFFDRGNTVAGTGNFDYAIEMYLSGIALDPNSVEAHQTLRDISLKRKASGGKAIGFMAAMGLKRPTKDDKQNLINSEKLLANDPGNTDYMVGILQSAARAGYTETVLWIGPILQKANADAPKPEVQKFIILRDCYKAMQKWKLATDACHYAAMLRPDDMDLQNELKNLGAKETIRAGNYEKSRNFTDSVRDKEAQDKYLKQDGDVRTMDQMGVLIKHAKAEYDADPLDAVKIGKYVDVLVKTEQPELENQAIELLQSSYDRTKQFRFRQRIGLVKLAQMSRMERTLRAAVQASPTDNDARQSYAQFAQEKLNEELSEFQLALDNYPTDTKLKYDVATRLFMLKRYDEAIPILQQLRQDPRYRIDATGALGKAFLEAGFVDEAVDTLAALIADYPTKGDAKSIDMTYVYGRALESKKEIQAALKAYSQVAQWNFNYRDTQARIKKLRAEMNAPPTS